MDAASPTPRPRPILVYDGDCGFCTGSVEFAVRHLPADVDFVPWQDTDLAALGLSRQWAEREIVWVPAFVDPADTTDPADPAAEPGDASGTPDPTEQVRRSDRRAGAWWRRVRFGRRGGAQAAAAYLVHRGGLLAVLGWLARVPPMRWLAAAAYRLVAASRHRLPGGTPACARPVDERPGRAVSAPPNAG